MAQQENTTETERWLPAAGFETCYEVSSMGRVRSIARVVWWGGAMRPRPERILKPNFRRYSRLSLGKHRKDVLVHRLVLETFVGPCPPGHECRHLDSQPTNNNLSNLVWGTHTENMQDRVARGTSSRGERAFKAKLNDQAVTVIRHALARGVPATLLARLHGGSLNMISCIRRGRTWRHLLVAVRPRPGGAPELVELAVAVG